MFSAAKSQDMLRVTEPTPRGPTSSQSHARLSREALSREARTRMHDQKTTWPVASILATASLIIALNGCRGLVAGDPQNSLQSVNHIVFMAQENRGFDHYLGAMREYWASNGFPDQAFDGLPQFNPAAGIAPLRGAAPTNPGCDPAFPPPSDCKTDANSPDVESFRMVSMCEENPSPSWNESHVDWNLMNYPVSPTPTLDGYVWTAAHDARNEGFTDVTGKRAMSYYDENALPYYYFMASNFATSDRWFSPTMSRTQPNRMYMLAATSAGHVYPLKQGTLSNPTIFDRLQSAGISWKVYVTDLEFATPPINDSTLTYFGTAAKYPQNMVPVSQYLSDVQNGTLPSVAFIDPGYDSGRDEHPGLDDGQPGGSVQVGAQYVSTLINSLMQSPSWQDSVFILTYDEFGGFYDHVPPQPAVSPDGIKPLDLLQGPPPNGPDVCVLTTGPTCDFVYTGYRVPLIVISPFAKKNYVSHTVADYTAWLKLVETRFNLPSLTKRDAAQIDMTEFFDFVNVPWSVPPTPPAQPANGACYLNHLP
jgi:phospholipase C